MLLTSLVGVNTSLRGASIGMNRRNSRYLRLRGPVSQIDTGFNLRTFLNYPIRRLSYLSETKEVGEKILGLNRGRDLNLFDGLSER